MRCDPAHLAGWENQAIFRFVASVALSRFCQQHANCIPIIRVDSLQDVVELKSFHFLKAEQCTPTVRRPNFVPHEVSNPNTKMGTLDSEVHSFFTFAQSCLTHLKLAVELRRAERVIAQLVPHHRDDAKEK